MSTHQATPAHTAPPPNAKDAKADAVPLPESAYCKLCGQVLPPLQIQEFPKVLYKEKPKDKADAGASKPTVLTVSGFAVGHDVQVQVKQDQPEPEYETITVQNADEEKKKESEGYSKDVPKPKDAPGSKPKEGASVPHETNKK